MSSLLFVGAIVILAAGLRVGCWLWLRHTPALPPTAEEIRIQDEWENNRSF